jgi:hypothetical protein
VSLNSSFFSLGFFMFFACSSLEGSTVQVSEQGLRKVLYQKVRVVLYCGRMALFFADSVD